MGWFPGISNKLPWRLRARGYTNADSPSLAGLHGKPRPRQVAYCDSERCGAYWVYSLGNKIQPRNQNRDIKKIVVYGYAKKQARRGQSFCTDCSSALVWYSENKAPQCDPKLPKPTLDRFGIWVELNGKRAVFYGTPEEIEELHQRLVDRKNLSWV